MRNTIFIGLMSGTSLDGVDVALVEFYYPDELNTKQIRLLDTNFLPYPANLKTQILSLQHPSANELEITALISNTLAILYAKAISQLLAKANITAKEVSAIGCHGQTIRHQPKLKDGIGFTLQIGNAALLAELTEITVISDFRSRDIAAGGQGAPLVPAFHQAMFAHNDTSRAIINIGGIANITLLDNNTVIGFDSGPGNMLLDAWVKQHQNLDYDANGAWANTGKVIAPLLTSFLTEPYFALPPPKSTGRDLFNNDWLENKLLGNHYLAQDVAHTLVALTVHSIANALHKNCNKVDEIYLCGGGAHNSLIRSELQMLMVDTKIDITDNLGIGVDWLEAIAFAWLAKQCLEMKTSNLPEVTGAKGPRILGAIYQY